MKYIILFEDTADADPNLRNTHMQEHLAFLERHADVIEAAGPLNDPAGKGRDGLWIVEAKEESRVEELIRMDPFWPTGLRASFSILPWTQVFRNGKRQINP
ncbi:YciI family protein [Roseobacter sp. EG26]|uniref:YciI family protein n=1 Tax=Roseobacter sp. EG26 TaxID=3412477 RepID=UPI003CE5475B